MPMNRRYISPQITEVQVTLSSCLCTSYGTIPVGGRTDSFDDSNIGTISTGGGRADDLDAPRMRDWDLYESY